MFHLFISSLAVQIKPDPAQKRRRSDYQLAGGLEAASRSPAAALKRRNGPASKPQLEEIGMTSIDKFEDHCWKDVIPEADMRLYAGWRRETFVGARPALLAIDLYNLVYRGGPHSPYELNDRFPNTCGLHAHRAIAPTKRLFAAARAARIPIFYSTQDIRPNNRPPGAVSTRRQRRIAGGPDDYAIHPEFAPEPSDIVIYKQRASAFAGTPLYSHLALLGIQSLIVCGESTSGCVRASAVDGYSSGLHVTIVEECTYDRAELTHKVNLFDLHHKYADVMHIEEVVAHLDGLRMGRAAE
jgi:maleamate amidohydrolase